MQEPPWRREQHRESTSEIKKLNDLLPRKDKYDRQTRKKEERKRGDREKKGPGGGHPSLRIRTDV